jgi:hypothetical protein
MLAKAHSEKVLAAYLFHGWSISSVRRDSATGQVSEHLLRWTLSDPPLSPSAEEIERFIQISVVEDKFAIARRGCVIVPGLPRSMAGAIKHGDFIVLLDYAELGFLAQVRSIELSSPPSLKGWAIMLSPDVPLERVTLGLQVWVRTTF